MTEINIYCDESCHLENDSWKVMVLGAITCPDSEKRKVFERIREIKQKHNLSKTFEIKWTKVSKSKVGFYLDLIDYFFDNENLGFRAIIIPDKNKLNHDNFKQTLAFKYFTVRADRNQDILQFLIDNNDKDVVEAARIKSEKIPVGTSNNAEETIATENKLIPNAYEPVT